MNASQAIHLIRQHMIERRELHKELMNKASRNTNRTQGQNQQHIVEAAGRELNHIDRLLLRIEQQIAAESVEERRWKQDDSKTYSLERLREEGMNV